MSDSTSPRGEILVNDRCLYRGGTGVAMYLHNVLRHWPGNAEHQLTGLCTHLLHRRDWPNPCRRDADLFKPLPLRPLRELDRTGRLPWRLGHPVRHHLQRSYAAAFAARSRHRCVAAVWEPNHLAIPTPLPTVTTVHDLSVLDHPQWHPADRVAWYETDVAPARATTQRWITPSQFTADRLAALLAVRPDTIDVIPEAPRELRPPPGEPVDLLSHLGLDRPFVLHLGTLEPRKNIPLLLDAWQAVSPATRADATLLLAGSVGWGDAPYCRALADHPAADDVLMCGYVSDAQAAALLTGAKATLVPSTYEGFGLPIVEAMAAPSPVLCSDIPVFREVAAQAATLLDPGDATLWARAIERALSDEDWRDERMAVGLEHVRQFSWERTAAEHRRVIEATIAERPR
ncbi:MAG: glycosyltransferase family 4 protein [Phycisphaerae bacterium]